MKFTRIIGVVTGFLWMVVAIVNFTRPNTVLFTHSLSITDFLVGMLMIETSLKR